MTYRIRYINGETEEIWACSHRVVGGVLMLYEAGRRTGIMTDRMMNWKVIQGV